MAATRAAGVTAAAATSPVAATSADRLVSERRASAARIPLSAHLCAQPLRHATRLWTR